MRRRPESSRVRRGWLVAGAWAFIVAVLLLLPSSAIPSVPWWLPESFAGWIDCLVHGVLFFVQTALLLRSGWKDRGHGGQFRAAAYSFGYAVVLELLQIPVPGRSFQVIDLVFAVLGIAAALVMAHRRRWRMRPPLDD